MVHVLDQGLIRLAGFGIVIEVYDGFVTNGGIDRHRGREVHHDRGMTESAYPIPHLRFGLRSRRDMAAGFGDGLDHNMRCKTFELSDQFRVVLGGVRTNKHLNVAQVPGTNPFGKMESAKMLALDEMR